MEAARAQIEQNVRRPLMTRLLRNLVFERILPSRAGLRFAAFGMRLQQASGIKFGGRLGQLASLAPRVESPSFFSNLGRVFPANGERKYRVAFLSGCIANVCFARLNDATVRVLQHNGCEVSIPADQTCCGALHVHSGLAEFARGLARRNIDAFLDGGFDAIITNAAGCGSTLKEYGDLLEGDHRAEKFAAQVKDVSEFLASIELNPNMGEVRATVTYQDSCHLAHGQKIRSAPRQLLGRVPGLTLKEMRTPDACCGSAGIYNVLHTDLSMALLEKKMEAIQATGADRIVTANPGCMLQLRVGADRWGRGQQVSHVVEILDEAYRLRNNA